MVVGEFTAWEKKNTRCLEKKNNLNLLKLRWDQRRVKTRRVFSDRTCDWCLQASQSALCSGQSSYMTWILLLHDGCNKAASVQMCSCCEMGAPPRWTICAVTTAAGSRNSRSAASAALEAHWLQATEDWRVFMFTFQEERLGRFACIGWKRLQRYWQITEEKWRDAEPRTGELLPLFTRNHSAKSTLESVVISSLQVGVRNYKINLWLRWGLIKNNTSKWC